MNRCATAVVLGTIAMLSVTSFALAQSAPPTYRADPSIYKVIFEDQNFRVIEATWKNGEHDKGHSHPVASVAYGLTDCHAPARAGRQDARHHQQGRNGAGGAFDAIAQRGKYRSGRVPGAVGRAEIGCHWSSSETA